MSKFINVRPPAVAGQFYPAEAQELNALIDKFLSAATLSVTNSFPRIIISPHAGYFYSGSVTAFAFKSLIGSGYKRAVIVGRSHHDWFDGLVADDCDEWETPLGKVTVDKKFIDRLREIMSTIIYHSASHEAEHSLEVIVPFLQKVLGPEIKIVPLLFGADSLSDARALSDALSQNLDADTVVVISSDLSHYPKYADAIQLDQGTIEGILTAKADKFVTKLRELEKLNLPQVETLACGEIVIASALMLAEKLGFTPRLFQYGNSGDSAPETKAQVVGYAAMGFYENTNAHSVSSADSRNKLSLTEQKFALQIARETLATYFANKKYQPIIPNNSILNEPRGAFVTLRINDNLRGCVGLFMSDRPLYKLINEMALDAALHDQRFMPLTKNELNKIIIEISVLSPMKKINSVDEIVLGQHGVYIKSGRRSGTYLPQVAENFNFDKEKFLDSLCVEKAGLPVSCWRDGTAELYIYMAQVFGED